MSSQKSDISRRGFLTASISGLVSAGIVGMSPKSILAQEMKESKSEGKIIYRKLGRTGFKLPIISMGGGAANSPALVQAAYEKGVRHFDTAANYGFGRNEQMIGEVLHRLGVRDKANIGTKILIPQQRAGVDPEGLRKKATSLLEASLKRLKTDYIDILHVHDVSSAEDVRQPGLVEAFKELKKSGKVRAIGLTTHANMAAVINEAARTGDWDVILTSINFTMAEDPEMMGALKNAADKGIGIIGMKVLAGGSRWPNPEARQNYSSSTVIKACLKWVMNNDFIHTSIPGFANFDHLNENWEVASNINYTDDEKKLLGDNNIRLSLGFCRQCRQCLASCPHDTEIPTLMRTHMYAAQYGDFRLARTTLEEIPKHRSLSACVSCSECVAGCAHKTVDIASRIADLKLMYA